jgi:hypothetical protein
MRTRITFTSTLLAPLVAIRTQTAVNLIPFKKPYGLENIIGSQYLFCDTRTSPHCVSKIKQNGQCRGFEGVDACHNGVCFNGFCIPGATPSTPPPFATTPTPIATRAVRMYQKIMFFKYMIYLKILQKYSLKRCPSSKRINPSRRPSEMRLARNQEHVTKRPLDYKTPLK